MASITTYFHANSEPVAELMDPIRVLTMDNATSPTIAKAIICLSSAGNLNNRKTRTAKYKQAIGAKTPRYQNNTVKELLSGSTYAPATISSEYAAKVVTNAAPNAAAILMRQGTR